MPTFGTWEKEHQDLKSNFVSCHALFHFIDHKPGPPASMQDFTASSNMTQFIATVSGRDPIRRGNPAVAPKITPDQLRQRMGRMLFGQID